MANKLIVMQDTKNTALITKTKTKAPPGTVIKFTLEENA